MKTFRAHRRWLSRGMTLIELLVVISIIAVLAGLILPAVSKAKQKAKVAQARKEMADVKAAISIYESDYSRMPSSTPAMSTGADFTYGTIATGYALGTPNPLNNNAGVGYQASSAELMLILTASTAFPNYTTNACNTNDLKNPRRTVYLNVKRSGDTNAPGLGIDGVYRDPWGSPYVISLDLNHDGITLDAFYRLQVVSQITAGSPLGLVGTTGTGNGNNNNYGIRDGVMVWSAGPDEVFDNTLKADGVRADGKGNKDNVLSWQ